MKGHRMIPTRLFVTTAILVSTLIATSTRAASISNVTVVPPNPTEGQPVTLRTDLFYPSSGFRATGVINLE